MKTVFNPIFQNRIIRWWTLFLLLNLILFMPRYVWGSSTMLTELSERESIYRFFSFFFRRTSDDPFRISFDLVVVLWVAYFLGKKQLHKVIVFLTGLSFLFLSYMVYDALFKHLYAFKPILANDIVLFKFGFSILWDDSPLLVLTAIPIAGLVLWLLFQWLRLLVEDFYKCSVYKTKAFLILTVLCGLSLVHLHISPLIFEKKKHIPIEENATFNLISLSVLRNVTQSIAMQKKINNFSIAELKRKNEFLDSLELPQKPNVYIIFLESYGSVLYHEEQVRDAYQSLLIALEKRMNLDELASTSIFSTSPVSGGGSWLAYTSMFYGTEIANQGLYQKLVYDTAFHQVTNLLKWFRKKDYKTYFLAPKRNGKIAPDYQTYGSFYGIDHWITPEVFDHFEGERFGWSSPPPDQYSLNFSHENFIRAQGPSVLFFLTKNSHSPFKSPIEPAEDWKTLNNPVTHQKKSYFSDIPEWSDYLQSIKYEMSMLTQFAIEQTQGNDVVLLVGDHQPPYLTPSALGKETMIHVICRNPDFIEAFGKHGFTPGLLLPAEADTIHHEDFLWMFVEAIAQTL